MPQVRSEPAPQEARAPRQPQGEQGEQGEPVAPGWLVPRNSLDLLLAITLTVDILLTGWGLDRAWFVPAALMAGLPLAYRRRWPLPVFALVFIGVVASATTADFWPCIIAMMVAAYSVGQYGRRPLLAGGVLALTATATVLAFGGAVPIPEFLAPYLILGLPWLAGSAIANHHQRIELLQERAARLEQERSWAVEAAQVQERERIAREMHDVIAHSVSVMIVQAGAARQVMKSSPEQATDALLSVESMGREAMAELRGMLGVLHRDSGTDLDLTPQPGVEQIEALVHRLGDAGLPVELHINGKPRPLPQGLSLAVYRIVQEALTNALKYAGQACTQVALNYSEHELKIEVLDEGMARPSGAEPDGMSTGRGVMGMHERVAVYGGTLEAGPRLGGGYAVRAWLQLDGRAP